MKPIITFLLMLSVVSITLTSCKKDNDNSNDDIFKGNSISGKINNWNHGDAMTLYAEVFSDDGPVPVGNCKVGSDGSFSLQLSTPQDENGIFEQIYDNDMLHVDCSDKTARLTSLFLYITSSDELQYYLLYQTNGLGEDVEGSKYVEYYYVTNDCRLTGYVEDTESRTDLDLELNQGWNAMLVTLTDITQDNGNSHYSYSYSSHLPTSLSWSITSLK